MRKLIKITVPLVCNTTNNTVGTATTDPISGILRKVKVKSPAAVDSAATLATVIKDDDADTIAIASGFATQAANSVVQQSVDTQTQPNSLAVPITGKLTITGTLSANQAEAKNVVVTLYVESFIG